MSQVETSLFVCCNVCFRAFIPATTFCSIVQHGQNNGEMNSKYSEITQKTTHLIQCEDTVDGDPR